MVGRGSSRTQDTVLRALERAVRVAPERLLFDFSGDQYSYGEVDRLTNRLARSLRQLGVAEGDTVTTMFDNNIDGILAWLAINKLGAISVPLNTALRGDFLRHQVADAKAAIVLCESAYVERIAAVSADLPELDLILYRGTLGGTPTAESAIAPLDDHRGDDERPLGLDVDPTALACIIYTSGTTGPSKGCMISHNYIRNLAQQKLRSAPATAQDITFTPLPLFHLNAIASGVTATIVSQGRIVFAPRFSVSKFWPEIERSGATIASILGSMGRLLADAPDNEAMKRCHGQIHTVRGNPFPPGVQEIWKRRFGARHVGGNDYGLTEAAVVTSLPEGGYRDAPPNSSGRRNEDFDVIIVDDDDIEVPPGTSGEVLIRPRAPHVMFEGYWRRPEDTLKVLGNLWFHSGDIGKFDEDGFFYFVDRKKDYLRRRGENISSFEMEATFSAHPDIEDVAVHAVESPVGEDDVKVTAVLRDGADLAPEDLCRWSIDRVPYYAVPRYIEFRGSLPKNPQGRVLKYQLRDEGATPDTWDRDASDLEVTRR